MALRYVYNSSGGDPVIEAFPLAAVNVANNSIAYYNGAGFLTNVYVDANTVTTVVVAGAVVEAVDNSGGAAGDLMLPHIATKDARYIIDTTGAVERTDIGTNVSMDSILVADEDDPLTSSSGVIRMLNVEGVAGTATQALASINYGTP